MILFVILASPVIAAQEPRAVAEEALKAWRLGDAKRLLAVAHPELMKRSRDSRIVQFYLEDKPDKKKALGAASDADTLAILCEALRAIVPRDERFARFDRFKKVVPKKDLMIVVFESGVTRASDGKIVQSSENEVVLKRVGDDWLFLWSVATQVHIDLSWDPRD